MIILIGTRNPAKTDPTKELFNKVFGNCEFYCYSVPSNVSDMPLSDDEAIEGATNRAINSIKKFKEENPNKEYNFSIGLEGSAHDTKYGMFLTNWVVIIDKNNKKGIGGGPRCLFPQNIREEMLKGKELGPLLHSLYPEKGEIRKANGAFGLWTNDLITRPLSFTIALSGALATFVTDFYN